MVTKTEYAHIVLALRNFHSSADELKSIMNIDPGISLSTLLGEDKTSILMTDSKKIREMLVVRPGLEIRSIPQFSQWSNDIEGLKNEEMWAQTLKNLYKISNHYKLIQHQYKILTMIATSKYMRYKMKIETSHECSHCLANTIETLKHIYMECTRT